jgi:hypothetical protein
MSMSSTGALTERNDALVSTGARSISTPSTWSVVVVTITLRRRQSMAPTPIGPIQIIEVRAAGRADRVNS